MQLAGWTFFQGMDSLGGDVQWSWQNANNPVKLADEACLIDGEQEWGGRGGKGGQEGKGRCRRGGGLRQGGAERILLPPLMIVPSSSAYDQPTNTRTPLPQA